MVLNTNEGHTFEGTALDLFPGRPPQWRGPLVEVDRLQTHDPSQLLAFLCSMGLEDVTRSQGSDTAVGILVGARGCAELGGVPGPGPSPVAVPECVAVAYRRADAGTPPVGADEGPVQVGEWHASWTDEEHAAAVEAVRQEIARGNAYQANVVGHRWAECSGDPRALGQRVARLATAAYGGVIGGEGWAVASASPEQLVRVVGDRITTAPIKGTSTDPQALRGSEKDRAEHIMIVDLERNDLARVTRPGSVQVEQLYALSEWAGLWHAASVVSGRLAVGVGTEDVLRALLPGGSVTGAPKHAACGLLAGLEPVGRGPAMGAFGFLWPGGLDLGLTIRTVAVAEGQVHLWAGGGITWGSDPGREVAEAHAKAAPVQAALQVRPESS
ncbi:MAG TPA: chorismate-binding protein [Mycobacteriales bacterium]|nr:chorismate-binding protein [Mycobacteriales bacterium]